MAKYKGADISLKPTEGMAAEARKFFKWREEGNQGGTAVAVARARQLVNRQELSADTVRRMHSFFSRHEVDKQAEGFSSGEEGYPSKGRVAWAAWGGDAGQTWARSKDAMLDRIDEGERAAPDALSVGDSVSWDSSGGRARGKIERIERDGSINVPDSDFTINGTPDDPAALIRLYQRTDEGFDETDRLVGHKFSTLTKIADLRYFDSEVNAMDRHIKNIVETDDEYVITYGKSEMQEPVATETAGYDEEEMERFDRSALTFRAAEGEMVDEDDRRVRMSLSSEEPVERSFGLEVLEHSEEAVDLTRLNSGHAPLLLDHDLTKQIGVVERTYLDATDRRLRAVVRFGKSALAREIYDDVKDGIRSNVSIGYQIRNMDAKNDRAGTVSVNSWMPYEASIVSVPADAGVGVNRSAETKTVIEVKETPKMTEQNVDEIREAASEAAKRDFQKNAGEIIKLAQKHNRRDLADKAIGDGLSVAQFRGVLLDAIGEGTPLEQSVGAVEMSAKEERDYSFMKAVRGLVNGSGLQGLEREVSEEIAMRSGREARGFYAPDHFWTGKRDLTAGTNSAGGFLKPTEHLGNEFVDALRARLVFSELGSRVMSGLKGDVAIPKLSTGVSAGFVAENGATSEVNAVFSQITMSPKSLGAFTDVSRLLMIQSDPSVEQIVRDDLLNSIAQKIEDVAIEGGGSNEPTGITGTTGIGSVAIGANGGDLTWQAITDLVKEVEVDNAAINGNTLAYLTNPKVKSHMASTSKVASTDSIMLLEAPYNNVYGYNLATTNNVPSDLTKGTLTTASALIFGDFSQLMMGFFSTPDILIDPYTGGSSGAVRIRVMQEMDIAVRHSQSFAACLDIDA
jgi:HK97 family phage major capsid protein/HK97 family phage prohead protease